MRTVLRAMVSLSGMGQCAQAVHAQPRRGCRLCPSSRTVTMAVLTAAMLFLTYRRALFIRDAMSHSTSLLLAYLVAAITNPLLLFGGWRLAHARTLRVWDASEQGVLPAAVADVEAEATTLHRASRVHAVHTLPRAVLLPLGASWLVATLQILAFVAWRAALVGGGSITWSSFALDAAWYLLYFASVTAPLFSVTALLCAHALRFARRIHAVAAQVPSWSTARVEEALQGEQRLVDAGMHGALVAAVLLSLVLVMVVSLCYGVHMLTLSSTHLHWDSVGSAVSTACYCAPCIVALLCVSEVSEGWLDVLHALYAQPAAVDARRDALGMQLLLLRQRGRLGVRVLSVCVTRGLVVKGLSSFGTALGVLLRLDWSESQ